MPETIYSGISPLAATPATATLANVASSATNVTLQAASTSRRGLIIVNDADVAVCVKFGATATATSYTVKIAAAGYYEMPVPIYQGIVDAIWVSAPTGAARVTQLT